MLLTIPEVLNPEQIAQARELLLKSEWVGARKSGETPFDGKDNQEIPLRHPVSIQLGGMVLEAISKNPLFRMAAFPQKIFPPLFNRYDGGQSFGTHVDPAFKQIPDSAELIRADLAATVFLAPPENYDGGELCIEDTNGIHNVKLPTGHLVLYPASSLHFVRPVTRGARLASVFWIQSRIRSDAQRTLLFDLDLSIQSLHRDHPNHQSIPALNGVYQNLLRSWSEN